MQRWSIDDKPPPPRPTRRELRTRRQQWQMLAALTRDELEPTLEQLARDYVSALELERRSLTRQPASNLSTNEQGAR